MSVQQVTIGSKNQVVVPKAVRDQITELKPGKKVLMYVVSSDTIAIKLVRQSWLEKSYGALHAQDTTTDSIKELERQRNEWDR